MIHIKHYKLFEQSKLSDNIESALNCVSGFDTNIIHETWGDIIELANNNVSGNLYWYHDDNKNIYISSLKVKTNIKQQGFGTKLLDNIEKIGKCLGATFSCLWVEKNSWMQEWYKRKGYEDYIDKNKKYIWMKKRLKNETY